MTLKARLQRLEQAVEAGDCPRCHGRPETVAGDDGPLEPRCPECGRPAMIAKVYVGIRVQDV